MFIILNKVNLLDRVQNLVLSRGLNLSIKDCLSVTLGGSHASGLATLHSDIDVRVLKLSTMEELFGLHPFEHEKLVEGESSINLKDDLDIEIYSTKRFFKDLYHGEIVPNEILAIRKEEILHEDSIILNEIRKNILLFKSKKFVFKNLGFIKGCYNQAMLDVNRANSPVRKERIDKYGYDTKKAEQSIRGFEIIEEYLYNDHFSVFRNNHEWLKSIREGFFSKEEYDIFYKEKYEKIIHLIDNSNLPKIPNEDLINNFVINFHKNMNGFNN